MGENQTMQSLMNQGEKFGFKSRGSGKPLRCGGSKAFKQTKIIFAAI